MILKMKAFIKNCEGMCDVILHLGLFAMCGFCMWLSIYQLANPI